MTLAVSAGNILVWIVWIGAAALLFSSGIAVILFTNPFYSALALIVNLASLAVLYLLLDAEFVAAAQVLVYAGAIVVMFLFVIAYLGGRADAPWAGGPSLLSVAALVAAGIDDITVSEPSALRRQAAEKLGAQRTLTPDELVAPFLPFDFADPAYDVVLECSGKAPAMESGIAQLAAGGTIVLVGSGIIRPALDAMRVLLTEITITGAYEYDVDGFATALATLASGKLPVDQLLHPDDVGLGGLQAALQGLAAGEITAKVLVTPN